MLPELFQSKPPRGQLLPTLQKLEYLLANASIIIETRRQVMGPKVKRITAALRCSFVLRLLLLGAATHAPIGMAQSPGTFIVTGDMTAPRSRHTATLLADGTVVIAGGHIAGGRTAELYDPRTGTFKATSDMFAPRAEHTATLLPDGKVLIAG